MALQLRTAAAAIRRWHVPRRLAHRSGWHPLPNDHLFLRIILSIPVAYHLPCDRSARSWKGTTLHWWLAHQFFVLPLCAGSLPASRIALAAYLRRSRRNRTSSGRRQLAWRCRVVSRRSQAFAWRLQTQSHKGARTRTALGLLVDVPVVSGDAIVRELGAGQPRSVAAWLGPTKLFKTMAFATVTNIVSYLPFLLLPGDTGKFLYSLPIVISCSLLSALLVSMTFLPLISSFLLQSKIETPIEERRQRGFTGWYFRTAKKAIQHRKLCLAASLVLLISGGGVFSTLKPQFFPKDLQYFSYIDVLAA